MPPWSALIGWSVHSEGLTRRMLLAIFPGAGPAPSPSGGA